MENNEQQAVEQTEQPAPQEEKMAPEMQAAYYLQGALPTFRSQLQKVTGVQGKRVLEALIESPLEQQVPGFTTKEAHDLYSLGTMIQNAKFILFQAALKDEKVVEEVQQKAVEEAAAEVQLNEGVAV